MNSFWDIGEYASVKGLPPASLQACDIQYPIVNVSMIHASLTYHID